MKTCSVCKQEKQLSEFHKMTKSKDGRQSVCKVCRSEEHARRYSDPVKRERWRELNAGYQARKSDQVRAAKDKPCTDCGVRYPWYVMEFDHLPQHTKLFNISTAVTTNGYAISTIMEEIAKCEVVCANCHRVRTHLRRQSPPC